MQYEKYKLSNQCHLSNALLTNVLSVDDRKLEIEIPDLPMNGIKTNVNELNERKFFCIYKMQTFQSVM